MFEVGFTELLLIFGLGLVVLGPEKLPRVAAQIGRWMGRARSMARQFREQLEEEAATLEDKPKAKGAGAAPRQKYYQPDDDTQRGDVSHADAGAEDPVTRTGPAPDDVTRADAQASPLPPEAVAAAAADAPPASPPESPAPRT